MNVFRKIACVVLLIFVGFVIHAIALKIIPGMDFIKFLTDISNILVAIFTGALLFGLYQTERWNKLDALHTFFNLPEEDKAFNELLDRFETERKLEQKESFRANSDDVFTIESAKEMIENRKLRNLTGQFLSRFEELAQAIRYKVIEDKYSYELRHPGVIHIFEMFSYFIQEIRKEPGNESAYNDFQSLAYKWKNRKMKEENKALMKRAPKRFWVMYTDKGIPQMVSRVGQFFIEGFKRKQDAEALAKYYGMPVVKEFQKNDVFDLLQSVETYVKKGRIQFIGSIIIATPDKPGGQVILKGIS